VAVTVRDRDPGRPEPELPYHLFTSFYDLSVPAEAIVDRWVYELECTRFLGDAFPSLWPNFGPGAIAAFMGLELKNGGNTVWFHCEHPVAPPELSLAATDDNRWFRRCAEIMRVAVDRFEGMVQIGMPDLGGNLDVVASYRPAELLLMDLYDYPADIKRLTWEAHEAWWWYFDAFNAILRPSNPGYTAWTPLLSPDPYYMLQCDFCYMIGPDMFVEFVQPELDAMCRRLANPFYHLDGPGQLPHLDHLLTIPNLKGIQWVPGAGQPDPDGWPNVYRRIHNANRLAHVIGGKDPMQCFDTVVAQLGTASGLYYITAVAPDQAADAAAWAARYTT
jgi:5-methyltetrahydrofolate--homocysteine methyltransferase